MPVGWEPDDDGFRGYVFATEDNSTVVLTIKGTSCYRGGWKCDENCVEDALIEESLFYPTGVVRASPLLLVCHGR